MIESVDIRIGTTDRGAPRIAEINLRPNSRGARNPVYVRIHQTNEDCYLELSEVREILLEMEELLSKAGCTK